MVNRASTPADQVNRPPAGAPALPRRREVGRDSTLADWVANQIEMEETAGSVDSAARPGAR